MANRFGLVRAASGVGSEIAGKASHSALSPDTTIVKRILSAKPGWRAMWEVNAAIEDAKI